MVAGYWSLVTGQSADGEYWILDWFVFFTFTHSRIHAFTHFEIFSNIAPFFFI